MATRLLVTGGLGFIGSNLVDHLKASGGFSITVLDHAPAPPAAGLWHGVSVRRGDIRDPGALAAAMAGQEAVVHLAADSRVSDSLRDPLHNLDVNVVGSLRVLEAARAAGVRQVVAASSGGTVVGETGGLVHESLPPRPRSPYGASKAAMEGYLSAFAEAFGLGTCSLRLANVYGPRSWHKASVVAAFCRRLLEGRPLVVHGDGTQLRDFVYVDDVAEGIRRALKAGATGVYQLGSGRATRISDLVTEVVRVAGRRRVALRCARPLAGEVHSSCCDIASARAAFGYAPAIALPEGVARTWTWFQAAASGLDAAE